MRRQFENEKRLYAEGMSQEAMESEIILDHGKGVYVYDINGKEYFDLSTGIFTNALGQCNDKLVDALKKQIDTLGNVHDFSTSHRYELLKLLNSITPVYIDNFAFASTGAEAVELALRAVYTYVDSEKFKVMTFEKSYHGKTGGVRLINEWRYRSEPYKKGCKVKFPHCENCPYAKSKETCNFFCVREIEKKIKRNHSIKAFLFEPVLGAAGVIIPPDGFWQRVNKICKENNVIMIDDEIFMSGGRLGTFFAFEKYGFEPDVVLMTKGISSGYPFSVVCAKKEILSNKYFTGYGNVSATYSSHPLGIEAALCTIKTIMEEKLIDNVNYLSGYISLKCNEFEKKYSFIKEARSVGILFAFEFAPYGSIYTSEDMARMFFKKCIDEGVKVGFGESTIRMCPPLNVKEEEIICVFKKIEKVLESMKKEK